MKKFLLFSSALIFTFGIFLTVSHAVPIELVTNGEFEVPGVSANSWAAVPEADVPGWSSSTGYLEIWGADFTAGTSLNPLGSDGLAHGQHHEVTYNSASEYTTQGVSILSDGLVDFSFDAWARQADGISYSLTGSLSGDLVNASTMLSGNDWTPISYSGLSVLAGETLTLRFESNSGGSSGAHIDQVSLAYTAVPEPATILLLGLGLVGLAGAGRKKFEN